MPRQEGLDLAKKAWITRQCSGTARLPPMHQSSRRGRGATRRSRVLPRIRPPSIAEMFGNDLTCSPNTHANPTL
jgi:hypothetical protein